jgi:hypothetical protein
MGTSVRAAGATVGMDDGDAGPAQSLPPGPFATTTTAIYADAVGEEEQSIAARMW